MTVAPTASPAGKISPQRIPPQDADAEMALLGSMMMDRDAIAEAVDIIGREQARWLYLPAHQKLFEVLLDIYDDPSKAIDLIVVSDELRRRDLFEAVGGQDYLIQLAESFADWSNAEYYARIVRDKGLLRDLIRCAGRITDQAYAGVEEARDVLDQAEQQIFNVTEKQYRGRTVEIRDAVVRLVKLWEQGSDGTHSGLATGFVALDELTSGFQRGDLIVLAARPSMGKTALGLSMALNIALDGNPVVFFSMEMSNQQVAQRLVSVHTKFDLQKLRRAHLSDQEIEQLKEVCTEFDGLPLFVDETPGMTAMELRSKARRLKSQHDIRAVFVDYLQLMHSPRAENRQVEIATISRHLKGLARELDIPVIAMAQLNRMPEGRQDKRPLLSDLRESGAIEQDADVVLLIHREEYYDFKNEKPDCHGKAELNIAKQRNGPVGTIELQFNKKLTRFDNLHVGPEPFSSSNDAVPF